MTDFDFSYGYCHALSFALAKMVGSGELLGLFVEGECIHTVFRLPHSSTLLDGHGAECGQEARTRKAARYLRQGDSYEWRPVTAAEVWRMVAGDRARVTRAARHRALKLLAAADACGG